MEKWWNPAKALAGWCNLDVFTLCDTFGPFDPNSCEYVLPCLYKDVTIHVDVWRKPPQYCKVITLLLIKKNSFFTHQADVSKILPVIYTL